MDDTLRTWKAGDGHMPCTQNLVGVGDIFKENKIWKNIWFNKYHHYNQRKLLPVPDIHYVTKEATNKRVSLFDDQWADDHYPWSDHQTSNPNPNTIAHPVRIV